MRSKFVKKALVSKETSDQLLYKTQSQLDIRNIYPSFTRKYYF